MVAGTFAAFPRHQQKDMRLRWPRADELAQDCGGCGAGGLYKRPRRDGADDETSRCSRL